MATSRKAVGHEEWQRVLALMRQGGFADAERACRYGMVRFGHDGRWRLGLAWALLQQERHDEALREAQEAARQAPGNPQAYRTTALIHLKLGHAELALQAARLAHHLAPDAASQALLDQVRNRFPANPTKPALARAPSTSRPGLRAPAPRSFPGLLPISPVASPPAPMRAPRPVTLPGTEPVDAPDRDDPTAVSTAPAYVAPRRSITPVFMGQSEEPPTAIEASPWVAPPVATAAPPPVPDDGPDEAPARPVLDPADLAHSEHNAPATVRDAGSSAARAVARALQSTLEEEPPSVVSGARPLDPFDIAAAQDEAEQLEQGWLVPTHSRVMDGLEPEASALLDVASSSSDPRALEREQPDAASVEAQLTAMLGASLFGAAPPSASWLDLTLLRSGNLRRTLRRLLVIAVGTALLTGLLGVLALGLERRRHERREQLATEVRQLLQVGSFERLNETLTFLWPTSGHAFPEVGEAGLAARAEANLYRGFDAHAARPQRLGPLLDDDEALAPADALVARGLLAPLAECTQWPELRATSPAELRDGDRAELLFGVAERAGDRALAAEALARLLKLEPTHLWHLALAARFHGDNGNLAALRALVEQMRDESPRSPYTRLAAAELAARDAEEATPAVELATLPPVVRHGVLLARALAALRRGELAAATPLLDDAMAAVGQAPPFVLDAAERLLRLGETAAARHLTSSPAWPVGSPAAQAVLARILAEEQGAAAVEVLARAFGQSPGDPLLALAYARLLVQGSGDEARARAVLTPLATSWSGLLEPHLLLAELALRGGHFAEAQAALASRLDRVESDPSPRLALRALLAGARAAQGLGDKPRALKLARRAARLDPAGAPVAALIKALSSVEERRPAWKKRGRRK